MAKKSPERAPAFQFYPGDWLSCSSIAMMSSAQEGGYIRLICYDWKDDGVYDDRPGLARLARVKEPELDLILGKFIAHPKKPNFLTHTRVQKERLKQKKNRKKKSISGKLGAKKRWQKPRNQPDIEDSECHTGAIQMPLAKDGSSPSPSPSERSISKDILEGYQLRLGKIFNRRVTTKWKPKEIKELKAVGPIEEEDFQALERFYAFDHPKDDDWRRQSLPALINNLSGEIDKAKRWKPPHVHGDQYEEDREF